MAATLRLTLRPSRRLAALLVLIHLVALAALGTLTLALWIRLALAVALAAALARALRRHALLQGCDAIVEITCAADGRLSLEQRDGTCRDAEVLAGSTVHPLAVLLRVRVAGRRAARAVVVFPDSVEDDEFRRLRVWLRWKKPVSRA
jgi:toxin CptA